ncbi:hypothetical protein BGW39_004776, partial [Mortierella sp. 14UC]
QQPATGSSLRNFPTQQQGSQGSQPPQHPHIQQLQQQEVGNTFMQQYQQQIQGQGYPASTSSSSSQGGYVSAVPGSSDGGSGYASGMTGGGGGMREDYNFSLFPQQETVANVAVVTSSGAGSPAGASGLPTASSTAGGASPGLFQDPDVISAVPNPFFGVPNTIDWDEWQQYISNAGLQKF